MHNLTIRELLKATENSLNKVATLGDVLKMLRKMNGYTQKALGEKLCTCRQHVQKWEYDIFRPTPQHLKCILELFDSIALYKPLIWQFYVDTEEL